MEQSGIKSALSRIGIKIGREIENKGSIYAKVNLLHEFGGDYTVNMKAGHEELQLSDSFNDTWLEYGIGADFVVGKNSYVYLAAERSAGSGFYKEWQWNAGVRYSF